MFDRIIDFATCHRNGRGRRKKDNKEPFIKTTDQTFVLEFTTHKNSIQCVKEVKLFSKPKANLVFCTSSAILILTTIYTQYRA